MRDSLYYLFVSVKENPACTKNDNKDKVLLTSLADQQEPGKRKHALVRDSRPGLAREEDRDIDPDKATDTNIAMDFTIFKFSEAFLS